MAKKLAVVVTHGIGSPDSDFHEPLRDDLKKRIPAGVWADLEWIPVHWDPVLRERQKKLRVRMESIGHFDKLRALVIDNLSDAAAYQFVGENHKFYEQSAYLNINRTFYNALKDAMATGRVDDSTHIIGVADSMGCHVMSSYIWDMANHPERVTNDDVSSFVCMKTIAGLYMSACNIPLLVMRFEDEYQIPIYFPGPDVTIVRDQAIWKSFYDPDDLLGYPLRDIYEKYYQTGEASQYREGRGHEVKVQDVRINAGGLLGLTPWSHFLYRQDSEFQKPLAEGIQHIHSLL